MAHLLEEREPKGDPARGRLPLGIRSTCFFKLSILLLRGLSLEFTAFLVMAEGEGGVDLTVEAELDDSPRSPVSGKTAVVGAPLWIRSTGLMLLIHLQCLSLDIVVSVVAATDSLRYLCIRKLGCCRVRFDFAMRTLSIGLALTAHCEKKVLNCEEVKQSVRPQDLLKL